MATFRGRDRKSISSLRQYQRPRLEEQALAMGISLRRETLRRNPIRLIKVGVKFQNGLYEMPTKRPGSAKGRKKGTRV